MTREQLYLRDFYRALATDPANAMSIALAAQDERDGVLEILHEIAEELHADPRVRVELDALKRRAQQREANRA